MKLFSTALAISALMFMSNTLHAESVTVTFDFSNPETLSPSIPAPGLKESVTLDGMTFTSGDVSVSFHATGTGNTAVRLYGSYDAGCNLRVYDGDSFKVSSLNPSFTLDSIIFETALSGTTADVDLVADAGEYEWLTNTWSCMDRTVNDVTFVSNLQSRISIMKVTLSGSESSSAEMVVSSTDVAQWYNLNGMRIPEPSTPGLYLCAGTDGKVRKVMLHK